MNQIYEGYKKNTGRPSEMQNNQRPISRYQRDRVTSGVRRDEEIDAQADNQQALNFDELFLKLNSFIIKNKIGKSDFMDNPKLFMNFEDFKDLFKKKRFELSQNELSFLFTYKNSSHEDGYILGETFFINFNKLQWSDSQNTFESEENKRINRGNSNANANAEDAYKINQEFRIFQDDILKIVEKEKQPRAKSSIKPKKILPASANTNNKLKRILSPNTNQRPMSNFTHQGNNSNDIY
jgi:hypothetical protein